MHTFPRLEIQVENAILNSDEEIEKDNNENVFVVA